MSTADVLTSLARDFDTPVAPRVEFADGLWSRIELELRPRLAERPARPAPRASLRGLFAPFARSPRRLALAIAVALLFMSGVATATYFGVRTWVAGSARGVQIASDFRLSQVVAPSTAMGWYWSTALSADGHDLYFVPDDGNVYRVRGVDGSHPSKPALFLTPGTVPDPAFRLGGAREWQALAPAPGGDLFVLGRSNWGGGKRSRLLASVVVVHPDGSTQTAVTYRELRDHGILPGTVQTTRGPVRLAGEDASFQVVAVGAHRFWLLARIARHPQPSGGSPYDLRYFLVEVVDPNGDGDWSDREAHRVSVPGSMRGFDGRHASAWWYGTPVAEPALPGEGASGSVLLPGSLVGKASSGSPFSSVRLYRLDDRNGDGDLRDPGEVTLAYRTGRPVSSVASRIDTSSGRGRRQLVLRVGDRISLVSGDRTTTDVGRSFSGWGVFGGPNGDIFAVQESVVATGEGDEQVDRVVRLSPGHSRLAAAPEPRQKAVRVPRATGSMLVLTRASMDALPLSTSWYRADGSRVGVAPRHVTDVCAASSGDLVAFTSDLTVPRESFVYVSSTATGRVRTVSENPATPVCPFDGRHLVLATGSYVGFGNVWTLDSYDVQTGRIARLTTGAPRYAVSPDASRIAYVERTRRGDALVLVDLATLRRHRIVGPFRGRELSGSLAWFSSVNLVWSADGDHIAFTAYRPYTDETVAKIDGSATALPSHRYSVMVADVARRRAQTVTTIVGGSPSLSWSPDGSRILVCVPDRDPSNGCTSSLAATSAGDVIGTTVRVVSVRGPHRNRVVARGDGIVFAGWSPVANVYAWADFSTLHLSDGRSWRTDSYGGNWGGWSPDGRYIAQGPDNGFAVIDVATGKVTHLARRRESEGGTSDLQARWWR